MIRSRGGRIQAWCAGLCAQAILLLACLVVYLYAPALPPWLSRIMVLATCVNLAMALANLLPLIRLDGYRVFCELLGVHDLLSAGAGALRGQALGSQAPESILAAFFTAITVLAVPCLIITGVSMTLPSWTDISLQTLATVMTACLCVSCTVGLIVTIARRPGRRAHHG